MEKKPKGKTAEKYISFQGSLPLKVVANNISDLEETIAHTISVTIHQMLKEQEGNSEADFNIHIHGQWLEVMPRQVGFRASITLYQKKRTRFTLKEILERYEGDTNADATPNA